MTGMLVWVYTAVALACFGFAWNAAGERDWVTFFALSGFCAISGTVAWCLSEVRARWVREMRDQWR